MCGDLGVVYMARYTGTDAPTAGATEAPSYPQQFKIIDSGDATYNWSDYL